MASNYSIETAHGDAITQGIRSYEDALRWAREDAERTGSTLYVVGTDDDGDAIVPEEVAPSVHVAISVGSPSDCSEAEGAMDYDVTLTIGRVEHEGGITLYPDRINGGMGPCGAPLDGWVSGEILRALDEANLPNALWRATVAALAHRASGPVTL